MEIEIREIRSDQLEIYKSFFKVGLIKDEENFRLSADDDADAPFPTEDKEDSFTLGAYSDNILTGIVSFARDGNDREKIRHKGTLFRMYVAAEFRGSGAAGKLINALLERVIALKNIEQINLTVVNGNARAMKLYKNFGFKTYSVEENAIKWKGKYFTENTMVLKLNT